MTGRGDARRRRREELIARPEATEGVSDAVLRAELGRQVVQAVTELPEEQRAVEQLRQLLDARRGRQAADLLAA